MTYKLILGDGKIDEVQTNPQKSEFYFKILEINEFIYCFCRITSFV